MVLPAIWRKQDQDWSLVSPDGYPDEATLHTLVEKAPQILPLAGSPSLVVLGREVRIGSGSADLLAMEDSGRFVIIEVKLARNPEARRAIIAQVLTYAAYLKGMSLESLERSLVQHLASRGFPNLLSAAQSLSQQSRLAAGDFRLLAGKSLEEGGFRLVFVLDSAPPELVRLVGYLQTMSAAWTLDLVTVHSYLINGEQVLVPQRVEPLEAGVSPEPPPNHLDDTPASLEGIDEFASSISAAKAEHQAGLRELVDWARGLERDRLASLANSVGRGRWTLLPRIPTEGVGLITIWNENGPYISLWRTVFERRAPVALRRLTEAGVKVGQGNSLREPTSEILQLLRSAYSEAASGRVSEPEGPTTEESN